MVADTAVVNDVVQLDHRVVVCGQERLGIAGIRVEGVAKDISDNIIYV